MDDTSYNVSIDDMPYIMPLKEAARYLGLSELTLKRRIYDKKIKAYKDGGYWKLKREWVLKYQNELLKRAGFESEDVKSQISMEKLKLIKEIRIISDFVEVGRSVTETNRSEIPSIAIKCNEVFAFLEEGSEYIVIVPTN